jgi:hypothetical protein
MNDAVRVNRSLIAVQALGSLVPAAGVWLLGAGLAGATLVIAGSVAATWSARKRSHRRYEARGVTSLPGGWRNG